MGKGVTDRFGRKVWGPYEYTTAGKTRQLVNLRENGKMSSMSYPRWLMECHLGRRLTDDETVDHIDEDPTNESVSNYQLLSLVDNIRKSKRPKEMVKFVCPVCNVVAEKSARDVRGNRKRGCAGPFCSKQCARSHQYQVTGR